MRTCPLALVLLLAIQALLIVQPLRAAPLMQVSAPPGETILPVVSPGAMTTATLHTHVATIVLDTSESGGVTIMLTATYDIRNDGKEALQFPITINASTPLVWELTQDGAPVDVTSSTDGLASATIITPANSRTDLVLTASRTVPDQPLLRLVYPTELLRQWRGQRSVRVDLRPDAQFDPASWLRIEPDTWRYTVSDAPEREWLFEGELPLRILCTLVAPGVWQELQTLHAAAQGAALQTYAVLGQRYQALADAAAQLGDGQAQARFLAQATAAYADGIRQGESIGASAVELAALHAGLAALHRARVVATGHAQDAQAMVVEAGLALAGVMVDDPRRGELEQWQVEGLRLMLADLRRRGDIPGALALIEQLQALPATAGSSDFLAQERQALIVQQAVQLIEQGDRATALALAGDLIQSPTLQPPAEYRNLFARWNVSTAMTAAGTSVRVVATPDEDRSADAQVALDAIVQTWRATPTTRASNPQLRRIDADGVPTLFELTLQLPAGGNGVALANTLPAGADWALLRVLLGQLGPQIETHADGLWQQVQVSQPIDLRAAGDQWQRLAAELDRQAAQFEADATGDVAADMQASQAARLRAANYRMTAQAWRKLAQDSQLLISLATPGVDSAARSWQVTVASPPQMLNVQVTAPNPVRLLLAGVVALVAILGVTALLWRLL
ncbi:MAG TPA: hypothetical protein DCL15_14215 [Chloroflexi bacterium]|nr:hypothetical protein [Chloroflexota bacterium]